MPPAATAHADTSAWRATGNEPPVFLDETGRRRPRMLVLAAACGLIAAAWLAGVVGGGLGFSGLPAMPTAPAPAPAVHVVAARPGDARRDSAERVAVVQRRAAAHTAVALATAPAANLARRT